MYDRPFGNHQLGPETLDVETGECLWLPAPESLEQIRATPTNLLLSRLANPGLILPMHRMVPSDLDGSHEVPPPSLYATEVRAFHISISCGTAGSIRLDRGYAAVA